MTAATEVGVDCGLSVDDIPVGEGRTGIVGDQQVAVFRLRGGGLRALGASCPHLGGPLADGLIDNAVVVCPLHNRTYDLVTGSEAGGGAPVTAWRAQVVDGRVHCAPAADST